MKWIVIIDEGRQNMSYTFTASNKEMATVKALEMLDIFISDACREYDEEYLPKVTLYEISNTTNLNILKHIQDSQEKKKKRRQAAEEAHERALFKSLQKKFAKSEIDHKPDCQCKSCVGM